MQIPAVSDSCECCGLSLQIPACNFIHAQHQPATSLEQRFNKSFMPTTNSTTDQRRNSILTVSDTCLTPPSRPSRPSRPLLSPIVDLCCSTLPLLAAWLFCLCRDIEAGTLVLASFISSLVAPPMI